MLPLGLLAACQGQTYALVQVQLAPKLGPVAQLRLSANDGAAQSTVTAPASPVVDGLSFPTSYVVALPPGATSLAVSIDGLDLHGDVIARGSAQTAVSSGQPTLQVTLSRACSTSFDCDQSLYCAGTQACGDGGACLSVSQSPLSVGASCNPGDAGAVGGCFPTDGGYGCRGFGVCGDGVVNEDLLPDGGIFQEQCDWGSGDGGPVIDGGNGFRPGACRPTCVLPTCGDGIVDPGEVCDEGSGLPDGGGNGTNHGCNATCTLLGQATAVAGDGDAGYLDDAQGALAQFNAPAGIAIAGGVSYVADSSNNVVRAMALAPGFAVTTFAGGVNVGVTLDGTGEDAGFVLPVGLSAVDGGLVAGELAAVRSIALDGTVRTISGSGDFSPFCQNGTLRTGGFDYVSGLAEVGDALFVSDQGCGHVAKIDFGAGTVNTVSPGVPFSAPAGIVQIGATLFFAESSGQRIWKLDPASGLATQFVGNGTPGFVDGPAATAELDGPTGLCTDGRSLYVVDALNAAIRQIDPATGLVTTVLGGPAAGLLGLPNSCAFDPSTGFLYVTEGGVLGSNSFPNKIVQVR
ncbi:MAG: NHL repeat-containing protein [Deltaproteobacteria bacterium]